MAYTMGIWTAPDEAYMPLTAQEQVLFVPELGYLVFDLDTNSDQVFETNEQALEFAQKQNERVYK